MRILIISNFYPPFEVGGWEQNSRELVELFRQRGYVVEVLTSTHGVSAGDQREPGVYRVLALESNLVYYSPRDFFLHWRRNLASNLSHTRHTIENFDPDLVFVHSMWNLAPAVPWLAEQLRPERVVYQMFGNWPHTPSVHEQYWQSPANRWYMRWPKRMLGPVALWMLRQAPSPRQLQFRYVLAVSHAIRQELIEKTHITPENIHVIYNGINPAPFLRHSRLDRPITNDEPPKILYAGGLSEHKGVHTLIEAFGRLQRQHDGQEVTLTILGSGHPDYEACLHRLVEREGISSYVTFKSRVPREKVASVLGEHDIFVLPSTYEPLARMLQEAMAAGLAVVGTDAWGTREVIIQNVNGRTFQPQDADGLARQLIRLINDPELRRRLGEAAQRTILERFTLDRMIDETEAYLEDVVSSLARRL
jgi:glycogen(starch) synthase